MYDKENFLSWTHPCKTTYFLGHNLVYAYAFSERFIKLQGTLPISNHHRLHMNNFLCSGKLHNGRMKICFISKEIITGTMFYCSTLESRFAIKCLIKEHFLLACG